MNRAAFLPCPIPTVTVRSAGTMSPPANTPGQPVIIEADTITVPSRLNSTPGTWRRNAVSASWPTARISVSAASVSSCPVGRGKPSSSSSITSTVISGPSNAVIVCSQLIRTPSRSASCGLFLVGGHLGPGAPVDDHRVVRAEPARHPGRVHRGVAAAVHGDPAADHRVPAGGDAHAGTAPRPRSGRRRGPGCPRAWTGARRPRRTPRRSRPRRRSAARSVTRCPQVIVTPSASIRAISAASTSRGSR